MLGVLAVILAVILGGIIAIVVFRIKAEEEAGRFVFAMSLVGFPKEMCSLILEYPDLFIEKVAEEYAKRYVDYVMGGRE